MLKNRQLKNRKTDQLMNYEKYRIFYRKRKEDCVLIHTYSWLIYLISFNEYICHF